MLISTAHNQAAIQNVNLASWIEGMSSNMAKNKLIPKIRKPGVAIFGCCLHVFPTPKMADADFILPHAHKFRLFGFVSSQNLNKNAKI